MILFEDNKSKNFSFAIKDTNLSMNEVDRISVRLVIEGVGYDFPGSIINDTISFIVPPLKSVVKNFNEGVEYSMTVDVISEDNYIRPFKDSFMIQKPKVLEAVLKQEENVIENKKTIVIEQIEEGKLPEKKEEVKIEPKKSIMERFLES